MTQRSRRTLALPNIADDPVDLGLTRHTAQTLFGTLHYVGPAKRSSDEVVLLLHGFGSNWRIWTPIIHVFKRKHMLAGQDIIAVDLPSFGSSENQLDHLQSDIIGAELCRILFDLGYTKIHVAGHSMGGFLALDMAARQPGIVSARILAGSYFSLIRIVNNPVMHAKNAPFALAFYGLLYFLSQHRRVTSVFNKAYKKMKPSLASIYEIGGNSFKYASQNGQGYDAPAMWGSITMPVYAAFGEKDALVTKQDAAELARVLPMAHIHTFANTGHSLLLDRPAEVAEAIFADLT